MSALILEEIKSAYCSSLCVCQGLIKTKTPLSKHVCCCPSPSPTIHGEMTCPHANQYQPHYNQSPYPSSWLTPLFFPDEATPDDTKEGPRKESACMCTENLSTSMLELLALFSFVCLQGRKKVRRKVLERKRVLKALCIVIMCRDMCPLKWISKCTRVGFIFASDDDDDLW